MFLIESFQVDDNDVINFLLSTEIIPLCLRTMEMGSELSKTVKHCLPSPRFSVLIQSFSYMEEVLAYLPLFHQLPKDFAFVPPKIL